MDGFAVISSDVAGAGPQSPVVLKITGDIPAGAAVDTRLHPGQAARIMTGASGSFFFGKRNRLPGWWSTGCIVLSGTRSIRQDW